MKLSVTKGPSAGQVIQVDGDQLTIGTDLACELTIEDPEVAPRHAELRALPAGGVELADLGSEGGTTVGGRRITEPVVLEGGETIGLGESAIEVSLEPEETGDGPEPDPASHPLVLHAESGPGEGATVLAGRDELIVGSADECDVVLNDPEVAARHASVRGLPDGRIEVKDLGGGIIVSGRRIEGAATLEGGESVRIGDTTFAAGAVAAVEANIGPEHDAGEPAAVTTLAVPRSRVSRVVPRSRLAIVATALSALALTLAVLTVAGVFSSGEDAPPAAPSAADIVAQVTPSTVLVVPYVDDQRVGNGTGWVYDAEEGLVVTNAHVVDAGTEFEVGLGGDLQDAEVVGVAPCEDLAVLEVDDTEGLETLPLGRQAELRQGEPLYAIGYPGSASLSDNLQVTEGVVSVVDTELDAIEKVDADFSVYPNVVQTDAAINPGNSGGPSVDEEGRLIGVNTVAGGGQNQNYAIGVDRVKEIVPDLIEGNSREWAGFAFKPLFVKQARRGVLNVVSVIPGFGAESAGLDRNDWVIAVEGDDVQTRQDYCDALEDAESGDTVSLEVVPPGAKGSKTVEITLD